MTADPLAELARRGVSVSIVPDGLLVRPKAAITDEVRGFVRENREAIIQALKAREQASDPVMQIDTAPSREEQRRQRVLAMLKDAPSARYAVWSDAGDPQYPGRVVLAVAIRYEDGEIFTVELLVSAKRFDGVQILDLAARHSAQRTLH